MVRRTKGHQPFFIKHRRQKCHGEFHLRSSVDRQWSSFSQLHYWRRQHQIRLFRRHLENHYFTWSYVWYFLFQLGSSIVGVNLPQNGGSRILVHLTTDLLLALHPQRLQPNSQFDWGTLFGEFQQSLLAKEIPKTFKLKKSQLLCLANRTNHHFSGCSSSIFSSWIHHIWVILPILPEKFWRKRASHNQNQKETISRFHFFICSEIFCSLYSSKLQPFHDLLSLQLSASRSYMLTIFGHCFCDICGPRNWMGSGTIQKFERRSVTLQKNLSSNVLSLLDCDDIATLALD